MNKRLNLYFTNEQTKNALELLDGNVKEKIKRQQKRKTQEPSLYKVFLHNDDYTTMEFVVYILQNIFNKSWPEAREIMLKVHHEGLGLAGVYTCEIAETKATEVHTLGRKQGFPLLCTIEKE